MALRQAPLLVMYPAPFESWLLSVGISDLIAYSASSVFTNIPFICNLPDDTSIILLVKSAELSLKQKSIYGIDDFISIVFVFIWSVHNSLFYKKCTTYFSGTFLN